MVYVTKANRYPTKVYANLNAKQFAKQNGKKTNRLHSDVFVVRCPTTKF